MTDEIDVNVNTEGGDDTATDSLVRVAEHAIDETGARVAALTEAMHELRGARGEIESLREEVRRFVSDRQEDFIERDRRLAELETGVVLMRESLGSAVAAEVEEAIEDIIEEETSLGDDEGGVIVLDDDGAASVVAAEVAEPAPPVVIEGDVHVTEADERHSTRRPGGRHFIRI